MDRSTRPSSVRVYQFHHLGLNSNKRIISNNYLLALLFTSLFAGGFKTSAFEEVFAVFVFVVETGAVGAGTSVFPCVSKTERFPVKAGKESIKADSIKVVAVTIVSFDKTEAVPRGFIEALETPLVNNAPASVLPGCNKTVIIKMIQDKKNTMYKNVSNLLLQKNYL